MSKPRKSNKAATLALTDIESATQAKDAAWAQLEVATRSSWALALAMQHLADIGDAANDTLRSLVQPLAHNVLKGAEAKRAYAKANQAGAEARHRHNRGDANEAAQGGALMGVEDIDPSGYRYRCPSCLREGAATRCEEHSPPGDYCVDLEHVVGCPYAGMPVDLLDRMPLN